MELGLGKSISPFVCVSAPEILSTVSDNSRITIFDRPSTAAVMDYQEDIESEGSANVTMPTTINKLAKTHFIQIDYSCVMRRLKKTKKTTCHLNITL